MVEYALGGGRLLFPVVCLAMDAGQKGGRPERSRRTQRRGTRGFSRGVRPIRAANRLMVFVALGVLVVVLMFAVPGLRGYQFPFFVAVVSLALFRVLGVTAYNKAAIVAGAAFVPAFPNHLFRLPGQYHDQRPDLRHAGVGAQHRGRRGRPSGSWLRGVSTR